MLFCNVLFCCRPRYITPEVQLLIGLRFFALGSVEVCVADFSGVCIASVSNHVKRVSEAIAKHRPYIVRMPETDEERRSTSAAFFALAKFPRVVGAIDCTHIRIQSPGGNNAENFRNRKGSLIAVNCLHFFS